MGNPNSINCGCAGTVGARKHTLSSPGLQAVAISYDQLVNLTMHDDCCLCVYLVSASVAGGHDKAIVMVPLELTVGETKMTFQEMVDHIKVVIQ